MLRVLSISVAALMTVTTAVSAQDVRRSLDPVAGDVYLMRNNFHNSLVVLTDAGVVRVDPINADAGAWLNTELGTVTDQAVTHLIYSHSHQDHASGGSAHPGAQAIAHENAPDMIDDTAVTMRVGDSGTLDVGGKTFEMTYLGAGHGEDMIVTVVRPENVAFIVDVAAPNRLPFRNFGGANIDDWMGQIKVAQGLDFEIFAPGHGAVGVKSDLDGALAYLEDLKAGVLDGLKAGKTVEQISAELTLDGYKGWGQYDSWRALNIEGMAAYLQSSGQVN